MAVRKSSLLFIAKVLFFSLAGSAEAASPAAFPHQSGRLTPRLMREGFPSGDQEHHGAYVFPYVLII
jgi:hypothetical protein